MFAISKRVGFKARYSLSGKDVPVGKDTSALKETVPRNDWAIFFTFSRESINGVVSAWIIHGNRIIMIHL